jgi:hypothetical protein
MANGLSKTLRVEISFALVGLALFVPESHLCVGSCEILEPRQYARCLGRH